ncbi:MAG: YqhA family protein [Bacteroidota bacterium]
MNTVLRYLVRGIGLLASLGLFLLSLVVMIYATVEGGFVVAETLQFSNSESRVIYDTMTVVDLFLLGFSVLIASVGIYELFVENLTGVPAWLQIDDFDTLKGILLKTAIVVMGVSFMGRAVTWDGEESLLNYGLAIGAVVVALSFFLNVKDEKKPKANAKPTQPKPKP